MALNFKSYFAEVESRRNGTSTATPSVASAPAATPNFFNKPPTHEYTNAPYSLARKAGGVMSGTGERPERSQMAKLNFQA